MYHILNKQGVLPLVTHISAETAEIILRSAADAGIKVIEFATRSANSKEVFTHMLDVRARHNLDIKIAVGSILTVEDAIDYKEAGADCIICPHIDPEIGRYCIDNKIYWIPGAATLNEVLYANRLGAELVKLFPADKIGGPGYVRAIKAPFPNLKLMPTGGVTLQEENIKDWFSSGVSCVGIGSHLFSKETLERLDYDLSYQLFSNLITLINKARN
ncbi:aldolase [Solitalea longa]|uniref:Aldolase n=1 Tax=Solitalea longa TaxID=2079460 RepID=A0A2S4ZZF0_9SPHI|nr:aldolase [Solitalea longa]POY35387.1 aldolase [Solitalea longa]